MRRIRQDRTFRNDERTVVRAPVAPRSVGSESPLALLQRTAGNRAVCALLQHQEQPKGASGPDQVRPEPAVVVDHEPDELDLIDDKPGQEAAAEAAEKPKSESGRLGATFKADGTVSEGGPSAVAAGHATKREVTPAGSPRTNMNAAGSTCGPDNITAADIDWQVVDDGKKWRAEATAFRTAGQINVEPTPSEPTSMTTPNTVNPVDGGNVNNTKNDENYWKFAIKEMKEYHTTHGGRSSHWHSTAASTAHEQAHWTTDWLKNVLGSTWPAAQKSIKRVSVPKGSAATAGEARAAMKAGVETKIAKFNAKTTKKWNAVPDEPGLRSANGYKAGQKVLNGLIKQTENYAKTKKW